MHAMPLNRRNSGNLVKSNYQEKLQSQGGYTLLELTVVIAIIGTLTAILLPVFAKTRENARRTTCASNMRQIGLAMLQYAQDNDDNIVYGNIYDPNGPRPFSSWATLLQPYMNDSEKTQVNICASQPDPIYLDKSNPNYATDYTKYRWQSYGTNGAYFVDNHVSLLNPNNIDDPKNAGLLLEPVRMADVDRPSNVIFLAEKGINPEGWTVSNFTPEQAFWTKTVLENGVYSQAKDGSEISALPENDRDLTTKDYNIHGSKTVRYRHLDSTPVLYGDGHVKIKKRRSIKWGEEINGIDPGKPLAGSSKAYQAWAKRNGSPLQPY